jgi:UDP-glucose 4-epimerase
MKNKSILVTGGMGFIGPTLVNRLILNNNKVTLADRLDYGIAPVLEDKIGHEVELVETELSEKSNLHLRIADGEFDVIIHMASMSLIPVCQERPDYAYQSNVLSALNLLTSIKTGVTFLNFSTSAVYISEDSFHEEDSTPYEPIDVYGWTKKHVEELSRYFAKKNNFPVINIRLANAVGYGETNEKLFGAILSQIYEGKTDIELGNISPKRDYISVDDISYAVENLIDLNYVKNGDFESFNIGTGYNPISVKEVFNMINSCLGGGLKLVSSNERMRPADEERELLAINVDKLYSLLPNYQPKKLSEFICDLVKNPGLRINNN